MEEETQTKAEKKTLYNPYKGSKTDRGRSITDKIKEFRKRKSSKSRPTASQTSRSRPRTARAFSKKKFQIESRKGEIDLSRRMSGSRKSVDRGDSATKNTFFSRLNTASGGGFGALFKRKVSDFKTGEKVIGGNKNSNLCNFPF